MIRTIVDYYRQKKIEMPDIEHFVYGADEQSLREQIAKFKGYYLFLDYGGLDSERDSSNRIDDSMDFAVTIAIALGVKTVRPEEVSEYQLQAFELITQLRKSVLKDKYPGGIKYLSDKHQVMPFIAPDICRSVGWTIYFSVSGFDLLNVKG